MLEIFPIFAAFRKRLRKIWVKKYPNVPSVRHPEEPLTAQNLLFCTVYHYNYV